MNISYYVKLYGLTVPIFFVIDLIWLGVVAKSFSKILTIFLVRTSTGQLRSFSI